MFLHNFLAPAMALTKLPQQLKRFLYHQSAEPRWYKPRVSGHPGGPVPIDLKPDRCLVTLVLATLPMTFAVRDFLVTLRQS